MSATDRAIQLRQRARHLRLLAERIEALPVMQLDRFGDVDTWRGLRPDLCRVTLAANQHQLHLAADDLRAHAYGFDQRAEELEAIARSQIGLAG
jgi:hypothetical protein